MVLAEDVVNFLDEEGLGAVSTIDESGRIHGSIKEFLGVEPEGRVYLIDLYTNRTFRNLKRNPNISVTVINEQRFRGYTLQGTAKIIPREQIDSQAMRQREEKIINRISKRVIHNVKKDMQSKAQFESELPIHPKYLIEVDIEKVIDLSPPSFNKKSNEVDRT